MNKTTKGILSERALDMIADRFKVLADPMRLRLLQNLRSGEKNVSQLVQLLKCGQANASKHLGILAQAGMLGRRREGLNTYYWIADPTIIDLCNLMCSSLQRDLGDRASHLP